ncbi:MAG TPA: polyphenol oxidase family protein [Chthoniobacterales bacterium]|nr:polyphenol oxidase family protein [Chthoniobacterales bacterium]
MEGSKAPTEKFAALVRHAGIIHCFTQRVPGIEVAHDKTEALRRLDAAHRQVRVACGVGDWPFVTAQQVHGDHIGVVDRPATEDECFDECDAVITNQRGVALGIYVADCCAVYLVDPVRNAIGLVHSGRKGTELDIVGSAIERMHDRFGTSPADLTVQLSPCIRPPHYEVDFAAEIVRSCKTRGVTDVHDSGVCTACHLDGYYSYRAEKGKTGRMLALLAMR